MEQSQSILISVLLKIKQPSLGSGLQSMKNQSIFSVLMRVFVAVLLSISLPSFAAQSSKAQSAPKSLLSSSDQSRSKVSKRVFKDEFERFRIVLSPEAEHYKDRGSDEMKDDFYDPDSRTNITIYMFGKEATLKNSIDYNMNKFKADLDGFKASSVKNFRVSNIPGKKLSYRFNQTLEGVKHRIPGFAYFVKYGECVYVISILPNYNHLKKAGPQIH